MNTSSVASPMVTEHAIRLVQKLSPAMTQAMLKVDRNLLAARRAPVGTIVALMRRELMGPELLVIVAPEGNEFVEFDYVTGPGRHIPGRHIVAGHLLTELGLAVVQVLTRGPEEALKRALAAAN